LRRGFRSILQGSGRGQSGAQVTSSIHFQPRVSAALAIRARISASWGSPVSERDSRSHFSRKAAARVSGSQSCTGRNPSARCEAGRLRACCAAVFLVLCICASQSRKRRVIPKVSAMPWSHPAMMRNQRKPASHQYTRGWPWAIRFGSGAHLSSIPNFTSGSSFSSV